ncbi:phosphoglycolate phosphatase [Streptomyces caniferus]|uniref:HAD family hydrolase n=1 Tax=Streptomyces caniferus TaxID=285557 RepID=UPI001FE43446|nr:HAD family hydrolase [Streptomyces caniferus]
MRGVRGAGGETIRAAVFDLDGTLANTLPPISKLLVKVASEQGCSVTARQAAAAIGKPPGPAFGRLLGKPEEDGRVQAAISRYRELFAYEVLCQGPQLLFPGVTAGLSALRAHGVELAVATSKTTRSAEALLDVMGIRDLVGPVIGQDMVRRGKPHPEMVLRAAGRLGVAAWQSAYVGDMRMAVTARMEPVAVTYGVGTFGELAAVAGTRMCSSFKDVVSVIAAARPRPGVAVGAQQRRR